MTRRPNADSALLDRLIRLSAFDRLHLVDVGCSGGINVLWRQFEPLLSAVGYDPLVSEIDRLNASEANPEVRYEAAFVSAGAAGTSRHQPVHVWSQDWHRRSSASAAAAILSGPDWAEDYEKVHFNDGAPVVLADRTISLSDVPELRCDVLKIDTDGHDYQVLLGAEQLIERERPLMIEVEASFEGAVDRGQNAWSGIDRLLQEAGYVLGDLDVWHYARSALPPRFLYDLPAQTVSGAAGYLEAVYFDSPFRRPDELRRRLDAGGLKRLLLLAAVYDVQGLPRCADDILAALQAQPDLAAPIDWKALRDCLG